MCEWNNTIDLELTISKEISFSSKERIGIKAIDSCIAPIVQALDKAGIRMLGSCCGHGKTNGEILLEDGRKLIIQ